ncbi:CBS domain-containing protein [Haloarcula halophila]|uniref:CBS domain-containing protein n=1 Tax=Haloarcula TaxID=2237 RepID=UPI0023E43EF4|nr:CBS domain-containing protein [Halomicroarcula sp. DFY41]
MKTAVTAREVMNREFVGASESDDLYETAELLVREDETTALVLRGNEPIGVVTEQDLLGHLVDTDDASDATVGDAMVESVPSVTPDARLTDVRDTMLEWSAGWLLVMEDGDPVGTVTEHDVLAAARMESENTEQVTDSQEVATAGQAATVDGATTAAEDRFEQQGICSACGTFTRNLASFNGQLLCADCRNV